MFGNFGKLFFTNAVLAGVASSCVCAGEETKDIEGKIQKKEFIPKDISLIKELDQENLNKEENKNKSEKRIIYAVKVLTAVGFISVFLLFLGQKYLRYKALKKVDDSWKDLDNGVSYNFSLINKVFEVDIIFEKIDSGNYIPNEEEPDESKPGEYELGKYSSELKENISEEEKERRKIKYLLNLEKFKSHIFKAVIASFLLVYILDISKKNILFSIHPPIKASFSFSTYFI